MCDVIIGQQIRGIELPEKVKYNEYYRILKGE